jgi:hypothetical protein
MEAATPLRPPSVRVLPGDRLAVDGLVVDDATAARLVREREERGDDPVALVVDAVEIGARVLDREQAGANAEAVKAEMERAARDLNDAFAERARVAGEALGARLDEIFAPDGRLEKEFERRFSDSSSESVQQSVKAVLAQSREELTRQFSAEDERNPLGDFKRMTAAVLKQAAEQQDSNLRSMHEKLAALELEVQRLHAEREKQLELAEAEDAGTRKGRTYEEAVFEAIDQLAQAQGDTAEAVGDVKEATGKVGDAVVGIDGCAGPARGRIVFEAKHSQLSRPKALAELDDALAERNADFAVLVVPGEDKVPARMAPLREYNGDKVIVTYDPQDGSRLALQVAYSLARARVLMARRDDAGLDAAAVGDTIERALTAMEDVRKIKLQLTGATTGIEKAGTLLDAMAETVRGHLAHVDGLLAAAGEGDD